MSTDTRSDTPTLRHSDTASTAHYPDTATTPHCSTLLDTTSHYDTAQKESENEEDGEGQAEKKGRPKGVRKGDPGAGVGDCEFMSDEAENVEGLGRKKPQ